MPTIQVKAGFYQPTVFSQPAKTFQQVLESINSLPDDETRTLSSKRNFHPVRLQNLQQWNGFWWGQAMRIRMHEEMQRAKLNGEVRDIEFADDEGLGESSAFLYHPGTNMLIFQEVHGAVSRTAFSVYLKEIGQVTKIDLRPAINPDALARIERLEVKKITIRMAQIHNANDRGSNRLAAGFFRFLGALNAGGVNMVVKPERDGLLARIPELLRELLTANEQEDLALERVSVTGTDDEEETVIDLLADRLVTTEEIEVGTGRRPSAAQRRDALWNAWNRSEQIIRRLYTPR
jgi:hypothetical protein